MGKEVRHFWIKKHRDNYLIEITVKDSSEARIESWIVNAHDKKASGKILRILKQKYGFEPEIPKEEFVSFKDPDLQWLNKKRSF